MGEDHSPVLVALTLVAIVALVAVVMIVRSTGIGAFGSSDPAGESSVTGFAIASAAAVPAGFAPPWSVFDPTATPFVNVFASESGGATFVSLVASRPGMLFHRKYYVSLNGGEWEERSFPQATLGGSNWIASSASASFEVASSSLGVENHVLVLGCVRVDGAWRCGCASPNACNKWSVQSFASPGAGGALPDDGLGNQTPGGLPNVTGNNSGTSGPSGNSSSNSSSGNTSVSGGSGSSDAITRIVETQRTRFPSLASWNSPSMGMDGYGLSGVKSGLRVADGYLVTDEQVISNRPGCGPAKSCTITGSGIRIDSYPIRFSLANPLSPQRDPSTFELDAECHAWGDYGPALTFNSVAYSADGEFIFGVSNQGNGFAYTKKRPYYCCDWDCQLMQQDYSSSNPARKMSFNSDLLGVKTIDGRTLLVSASTFSVSVCDVTAYKNGQKLPTTEGDFRCDAPPGFTGIGHFTAASRVTASALLGEYVLALTSVGTRLGPGNVLSNHTLTLYSLRSPTALDSIALPESAKNISSHFNIKILDVPQGKYLFLYAAEMKYGYATSGDYSMLYVYKIENDKLVPVVTGVRLPHPYVRNAAGFKIGNALGVMTLEMEQELNNDCYEGKKNCKHLNLYLLDDLRQGVVRNVHDSASEDNSLGENAGFGTDAFVTYIKEDTTYLYVGVQEPRACATGTCKDGVLQVWKFGPDAIVS